MIKRFVLFFLLLPSLALAQGIVIPSLPVATTPLDGTELIVGWQANRLVQIELNTIPIDLSLPTVTGILPVVNGGTGASTFPLNEILVGNQTNVFGSITNGDVGTVLTSRGAGSSTSADFETPHVFNLNSSVVTTTTTVEIPSTSLKITAVGCGGGGGSGANSSVGAGGGGGSGGVGIAILTGLTVGNTISVNMCTPGTGAAGGGHNGNPGTSLTITSGSEIISTLTISGAGGGLAGNSSGSSVVGGSGGTPSGFNVFGAVGNNGSNGFSATPGTGAPGWYGVFGQGGTGSGAGSPSTGGGQGIQGFVQLDWVE